MKSILLCTLLLFGAATGFAQESSTDTPRYRNEIGIDATAFIKNILDFDDAPGPNYSPTYYLTYRRYIGSGALRAGIGGSFSSGDDEGRSSQPGDTVTREFSSRQLDVRLGYEFYTFLARRWKLYYGADALLSRGRSRLEEEAGSGFGQTERVSEATMSYYGVGPLLGIQFRLTPRISLRTEASFAVYRIQTESESTARLVNPGPTPVTPQTQSRTSEGYSTSFQQPVSVFINFDL